MSSARILSVIATSFLLAACGSDSPTGNDDDDDNPNTTGTHMTATIDGQPFVASKLPGLINVLQVEAAGGRYILLGTEATSTGAIGRQVSFAIGNISAPGTYPLGVDGVSVTGGFASITQNGQWTTPLDGASGSITVTALTPTRIAGTFNFTADALSGGATGTKVVTAGSFDAPMGNTAVIQTLADSIGSKMSATIGGASFNGAIVSGQTSATHLVLFGTNKKYNFTMTLPRPPATGTYALSNASGSILTLTDGSSAANSAPNCCYGVVGDVGSLNITSMTTTRIKGTFTATLTAKPGTTATGTISVTNGSFDIGLYHN